MIDTFARRGRAAYALLSLPSLLSLSSCGPETTGAVSAADAGSLQPAVSAASDVEAGRYLILVAGCNDCHTEGYIALQGAVPESEWLSGSVVGFRGPWGTTYAANLRRSVINMTEDQWVETLRTRTGLPPMPWPSVNQLSEQDARGLYRYIRSLGTAGDPAPTNLAPGVEPTTPWMDFVPQNLPAPAGS